MIGLRYLAMIFLEMYYKNKMKKIKTHFKIVLQRFLCSFDFNQSVKKKMVKNRDKNISSDEIYQ